MLSLIKFCPPPAPNGSDNSPFPNDSQIPICKQIQIQMEWRERGGEKENVNNEANSNVDPLLCTRVQKELKNIYLYLNPTFGVLNSFKIN